MEHRKIINYIKIREQWKQAIRARSNALSSIQGGLFRTGIFITYYVIENHLLIDEFTKLYAQNSNYKYFFYVSCFFGFLGVVEILLGIYNYFQNSQQVEYLEEQVKQIEKQLSN